MTTYIYAFFVCFLFDSRSDTHFTFHIISKISNPCLVSSMPLMISKNVLLCVISIAKDWKNIFYESKTGQASFLCICRIDCYVCSSSNDELKQLQYCTLHKYFGGQIWALQDDAGGAGGGAGVPGRGGQLHLPRGLAQDQADDGGQARPAAAGGWSSSCVA